MEVAAIKAAVEALLRRAASLGEGSIHSECKTLYSPLIVRSNLVKEGITSLAISSSYLDIRNV